MADSKNSKISELVELTDPSNADYIPIVDTANQETKKISYSSLINALNEDDDSYSKIEADALFDANTALITSNDGDIAALDGRVTTAEGNIISNDGDITTLQGRVTTAEGNITSNDGDITTLDGRVTTAEGNITSNDGDITTLQGRVTTAEGNITSNDGDITTLQGRVTTAESNITSNDGDIALKAPILNPTFTGTVTAPLINAGSIDFNAGAGNGGELSWNNTEKTLNLVTGSDNVTIQVGQEVVLYARNTSGLQMTDGQVVKVVGSQGNNPTIALAQADTTANARGVIGVVTQVIPNNSNGFVSLIGKVRDLTLDSGTYTEGDLLYLSSTVAGGFTLVRPDIGVEIGRVIATSSGGNNAGIIEVSINSEVAVHELEQDVITNAGAIAAKVPNDSTTGTPSGTTFLRGDNVWAAPAGGGDMLKSVYDPNLYLADAFSMGNMDETATALILTAAERSQIAANDLKVTNATHDGDVTGSGALTITDNVVTLAKMADMATASLLGRNTAGAGDPEVLSAATARSLLNVADGAEVNTINTTSTGEPSATSPVYNVVKISQIDYDTAIAAGSTVPTTFYLIT